MGWNQPVIMPRQPGFMEQVAPVASNLLTQLILMKLHQNWQLKQVDIETKKAQAQKILEAKIAGDIREPQYGQGETALPGGPSATWQTPPKGRTFDTGGETYEVVPMEERIKTMQTDYGPVLVGPTGTMMQPKPAEAKLPAGDVQKYLIWQAQNPQGTMADFMKLDAQTGKDVRTGLQKEFDRFRQANPNWQGTIIDFKKALSTKDPDQIALELAGKDWNVLRGATSLADRAIEYRDVLLRLRGETRSTALPQGGGKKIVRTGKTPDGHKVVQYEDGSIEYAD